MGIWLRWVEKIITSKCPNRQLLGKNWSILQTRMDQRVTTWRWIVSIFKFRNEIYKQLERKKDGKNEVSFLVSMFPSWVMVIKLSKKVNFCNFVMTLARSLSLLKQFTYMHLKGVITHSQKMVLFIMLTYCFGDITVWSQNFCYISVEYLFWCFNC